MKIKKIKYIQCSFTFDIEKLKEILYEFPISEFILIFHNNNQDLLEKLHSIGVIYKKRNQNYDTDIMILCNTKKIKDVIDLFLYFDDDIFIYIVSSKDIDFINLDFKSCTKHNFVKKYFDADLEIINLERKIYISYDRNVVNLNREKNLKILND